MSDLNIDSVKNHHGSLLAFIFVFNLIVGTGALTMPSAFSDAGWLCSTIIVTLICITSYISITFIIESMSIANFIHKSRVIENGFTEIYHDSVTDDTDEENKSFLISSKHSIDQPTTSQNSLANNKTNDFNNQETIAYSESLFDITERLELSYMAKIFFEKHHLKFFFACICIYLYGDLIIYLSAISKSLRDITCTYDNCNKTHLETTDLCWEKYSNTTRSDVYKFYVLITAIILGPFTFLNLQKTKYLQILTSFLRWIAFTFMILLASYTLIEGKGQGNPSKLNVLKLPNLFGVCVYSFMCHHSLPSLITPIKNKKNLHRLIFFDYSLVLFFYLLLSLTGIFTFPFVQDVYTLNFQKSRCLTQELNDVDLIVPQFKFLQFFLPLFPVFTLGTNFPIISITLTNNLKTLFINNENNSNFQKKSFFIKFIFPTFSILPPIIIALFTENLEFLVGIVGSYAGTGIQYIIPVFLVYFARKKLHNIQTNKDRLSVKSLGELSDISSQSISTTSLIRSLNDSLYLKKYQSLFYGNIWINFIFSWSILCIILVTIDHFISWFK